MAHVHDFKPLNDKAIYCACGEIRVQPEPAPTYVPYPYPYIPPYLPWIGTSTTWTPPPNTTITYGYGTTTSDITLS